MVIETLRNMPVGLKFSKLGTDDEIIWTGEIILESNEKKVLNYRTNKVASIESFDDFIGEKNTRITVNNKSEIERMGFSIYDIERLGRMLTVVDSNILLCKRTLNLPVKTVFKYEDSGFKMRVAYKDGVKKFWNDESDCEAQEGSYRRINILNYDKLKLYGYSRKDIEYICKSISTIKVAIFGHSYQKCRLYKKYNHLRIQDLTIEDRIEIAEDILKNKRMELYNEDNDTFSWEDETYTSSHPYLRIMEVARQKPWTVARDEHGFEYIKYFYDYDESLRYINSTKD